MDFLNNQFKQIIRRALRDSAVRNLTWSFVFLVFAESLLIFSSVLFAFSLPFFAFLIPLAILPAGFLFWLKFKPDSRQAVWIADRHLKLEERLITSFEVLERGRKFSQLENRLLEDTTRRLEELGGKISLPKGDFRLPASILLIALLLFALSPFVPPIHFSPDLREQALTRIGSLLDLSSALPGYERQILSLDLLKAQKAIEEGDWPTVKGALEEGKTLLEQMNANDKRAQEALASMDDLSFLAKGMEAEGKAALEQLKELNEAEMNQLGEQILNKLNQLPAGSLKSSLDELANSLKQKGGKLDEQVEELSSLFTLEDTLIAQMTSLLQAAKQASGSSSDEKATAIAQAPEGDLKPEGSTGPGTQGKGSVEKGKEAEDQKEYLKAPQGAAEEPASGLIYVPREFTPTGGEAVALPGEGEGKYQVYRVGEGEAEQGSLADYKTLLANFAQKAVEGFTRQALPLELRSLVSRYFMQLEEQP